MSEHPTQHNIISSSSSSSSRVITVCRCRIYIVIQKVKHQVFRPGRRVPKSRCSSCCCCYQFSTGPKIPKGQTPLYGHRLHTCCTTRSTPPTDELTTILQQICHIAMPEPNISTCQDVGMWQIFVRWWWICCELVCWWCLLVFGAGVRVVEFGTKALLIRSRAQWNFACTFLLTLPTDLPSQIFQLLSS